MTDAEIIIWSAATGSMGLVVVLAAAEAAYSSSRASMQSLVYLCRYWLFFVLLCGLGHTGVVHPAGCYYDRCFVVLIEILHSPRGIRTIGLRLASSLRKSMEVTSLNGERVRVSVDIGVGMVHLSGAARDVDELLHEVQDMAAAARTMRSRAALLDEISRQAVPVENAELGASWHAMRSARSHPARARQRRTAA